MSAPMGPFYTTELTIATSEAGSFGMLILHNFLVFFYLLKFYLNLIEIMLFSI